MRLTHAIHQAYSSYYQPPDLSMPRQGLRFSSTDEAGSQMEANRVYRAVERLPPHQRSLIRLCYTETGTEIDCSLVYVKLWQEFYRHHVTMDLDRPTRIGRLTAIAALTIKNFGRLARANKDQYSRREFAAAVGVTGAHYQVAFVPHQKQFEIILAGFLQDAIDSIKATLDGDHTNG